MITSSEKLQEHSYSQLDLPWFTILPWLKHFFTVLIQFVVRMQLRSPMKTYVRVSQTLRKNCSSLFAYCSITNYLFNFLDIEYAFSMHLEEVPWHMCFLLILYLPSIFPGELSKSVLCREFYLKFYGIIWYIKFFSFFSYCIMPFSQDFLFKGFQWFQSYICCRHIFYVSHIFDTKRPCCIS